MVRRSFLSLMFVFLLVFAQQEAMLHPYEHTADWQQKSSSDKQTPPHSESCGKCVALADICSAVGSKSLVIRVFPGRSVLSANALQSVDSATPLFYRSRAPPVLA